MYSQVLRVVPVFLTQSFEEEFRNSKQLLKMGGRGSQLVTHNRWFPQYDYAQTIQIPYQTIPHPRNFTEQDEPLHTSPYLETVMLEGRILEATNGTGKREGWKGEGKGKEGGWEDGIRTGGLGSN